MKKLTLLCSAFFLGGGALLHAQNTPGSDTAAYKFVLDYDVPESPAFTVLDLSPSNVLRGSAAKPAAINLINQFAAGGKLENGVALDFNPYFLLGGRMKSLNAYRQDYWLRFAANTQFSFATTNSVDEPGSMLYGTGLRFTFLDQHDILFDQELGPAIDRFLAPSQTGTVGGSETPTTVSLGGSAKDSIDAVYKRVTDRVMKKSGWGISAGFASSGIVHNSILKGDSIHVQRYMTWVGVQYHFGNYFTVLGNVQGRYTFDHAPDNRAGIGIRGGTSKVNLILETVWASNSRPVYGGNVEVKLFGGLKYIFSLSTVSAGDAYAVRVKSSLRWNPGRPTN